MATLVNDLALDFKQVCIISYAIVIRIYESQSKITELAFSYSENIHKKIK